MTLFQSKVVTGLLCLRLTLCKVVVFMSHFWFSCVAYLVCIGDGGGEFLIRIYLC